MMKTTTIKTEKQKMKKADNTIKKIKMLRIKNRMKESETKENLTL